MGQGKPNIEYEGSKFLRVMQSLITCMGGDLVQVIHRDVSVVGERMAGNVGNRRPRNIYRRWSEELLEGGQFHA